LTLTITELYAVGLPARGDLDRDASMRVVQLHRASSSADLPPGDQAPEAVRPVGPRRGNCAQALSRQGEGHQEESRGQR
jgi:hypothetical protein